MAFSTKSELPAYPQTQQSVGLVRNLDENSCRSLANSSAKIFIPNLSIPENSCPSSPNEQTYTHPRDVVKIKNYLRTEAFSEWLTAKLVAERYAKKVLEQQKRDKEADYEIRRQNNELKLKEWLQKKLENKKDIHFKIQQEEAEEKEMQAQNKKNDENDKEKCFTAWLMKKNELEKMVNKKLCEKAKQNETNLQRRKEEASEKYEKWVKTAKYKPKPVPQGQGLLSLRGTISKIYINPIPWVSCDEENLTRST